MKINGIKVIGKSFAYDGCHKIYICESDSDVKVAEEVGYEIKPISELEETYKESCSLRFISNWLLNKKYVNQFEDAIFEQ